MSESQLDQRKYEAEKLLPKIADIVWSDLTKAHHYIDKSLRVAVSVGAEDYAQELASISVRLANDIKYIQHLKDKYFQSEPNNKPPARSEGEES